MKPEFLSRMQDLLQDDYQSYLQAMQESPKRGMRVNLLKISSVQLQQLLPFELVPTPFARNSYILPDDYILKNSIPYAAGLFYVQEPSASSAVSLMEIKPGMQVLDLCAAPGSKSTQIAEYLGSEGLLVANEINPKRSAILKENLEQCGTANAAVLNADPRDIAVLFPQFFDAVLCDAPCSGEGMFRKNEEAQQEWTEESVFACAQRQALILDSAYETLKPGGTLVYSTCTFSKEENEDNVLAFLKRHPDMNMVPVHPEFGRNGMRGCIRVYPMDGGEGHFAAKMKKNPGPSAVHTVLPALKSDAMPVCASAFLKSELKNCYPYQYVHRDHVYVSNVPFFDTGKCRMIKEGLEAGIVKNGRFEPSHPLYQSSSSQFIHTIELSEPDAKQYLAGEAIRCLLSVKGYLAVTWHGHVLGFGKSDGTCLKNKYPKEYRIR